MKYKSSLCWIRRDLRLSDNHALYEALHNTERVTIVFVYDITILGKLKDKDDRRVTFIHESLQEMDLKLREMGSALVTLFGDPRNEIPLLAKKLQLMLSIVIVITNLFQKNEMKPFIIGLNFWALHFILLKIKLFSKA